MKLSKTLLAIPVATFLVAAAVASGACSASVSITTPAIVTDVPSTVTFTGGVDVGGACSGDSYVDGSGGYYLFCDGSVWAATETDPGDNGYTLDSDPTGGGGSDSSGGGSDSSGGGSDSSGGGSNSSGGGSNSSGGGSNSSGGGGSDSSGGGGGGSDSSGGGGGGGSSSG